MLTKIVTFFSQRHLLTNLIFFGALILGIVFWFRTSKEENPNISFDRVSISTTYPGASPEEVEHFLTRPIEEKLQTLDGIYRVTSTSSDNVSSIRVELEPGNPDRDTLIADIKSAVLDVPLPDEVLDDPKVRVFKTSQMAIIDIGLYREDLHLLDEAARRDLQAVALALGGALLGILLAWLILTSIGKAIHFPLYLPIAGVGLGTFFSLLIGVVSGLYPAIKASQIDPIKAIYYMD